MPRPRLTADTLFHQYVYFGLDPGPPASPDPFFSFLFKECFLYFFLLLHLKPVFAEVQRDLTQRFQMKKICIRYFPESSFSLSVQQHVCLPFPFLLTSILLSHYSLQSSCYFSPPLVHSVFSSCTLFQPSIFNCLVPSLLTPHPSTYLDTAFIISFTFSHKTLVLAEPDSGH